MYESALTATNYRAERLRKERRAKMRRRRQIRSIVVTFAFLLALIAALSFTARLAIDAAQTAANGEEEAPAETGYAEMVYTNKTSERAEAIAAKTTAEVEPATTAETEAVAEIETEPTVEEMLASNYLTDDIALSYDLQLAAREASETFNVPYKLLLAVMFRESSYDTDANNGICYGLMQIHNMNFDWLEDELASYGVTDIKNNPVDNIKAGAYMLGGYIEKYGDYHLALMCYNCGEGRAKELWGQGCYSTEYTWNVHETMNELNVTDDITER